MDAAQVKALAFELETTPAPAPGPDPRSDMEDHGLLDGLQRDKSISGGIVRAHRGEIQVEHHPCGGAVFRVVLPSLSASDRLTHELESTIPSVGEPTPVQPLRLPEPEAVLAPAGGGRILLVDDEPGICRSVGRYLRQRGYQVTEVPGAQAALHALHNGRYNAIVSDLRMPGLSGEEFFERLRQDFPDMIRRVVFTSGDILRDDARAFLQRSGCPSLQKPYELKELVQTLSALAPELSVPAHRAMA